MAWRIEHNPLEGVLELLAENGLEDLREPMTILLNAAMKIERERHLGAAPIGAVDAAQARSPRNQQNSALVPEHVTLHGGAEGSGQIR